MRATTVTCTVITAATLSALVGVPAVAAPASGPSGSIELIEPVAALAAPEGTESPSSSPPVLPYRHLAEFTTKVEGRVSSKADIYVSLVCWQGDTVVYQSSATRDVAFPVVAFALEDQSRQGMEWDGGDASCEAWLIYRVDKGRSSEHTVLGKEIFDVSGVALTA